MRKIPSLLWFYIIAALFVVITFLLAGCAELVYKNTESTAVYKKSDRVIVRHTCTKIQTPTAVVTPPELKPAI